MKLRAYLLVLVAAAILPVAAFSTLVSIRGSRQYRETLNNGMVTTARALALAIDSELQGSIRALRALATSRFLDRADLEGFRDQALRVRTSQEWDNVWLMDPDGRETMNTAVRTGGPVPTVADRPYFRRALETRRPYVSDLIVGRLTGAPIVVVSVPVVRNDTVSYVLSAALRPETFARIIASRVTERGVIVDGQGVMLARTPNPGRYVGQRAKDDYLRLIADREEGVARSVNADGQASYAAFRRVPGTPWTVGISVPGARVDAVLRSSLWPILAGALLAALIAGTTAVILARQLVTPIGEASVAALRLSHGEAPVPVPASRIVEVQALAGSLETAGELLHQRAQAAAAALEEAQQARAEAEASASRIDAENRAKDEFLAMLGHELRNPLAAIASAVSILDRVHPDEKPATRAREIIARQITHLIRIIDDLLDVGRVTAGKIVLDHRPVDLGAIVRRTVEHLNAAGTTAHHDVAVAAESAWVEGDENRLEQIVTNLLTNALKYTPVHGTIHVKTGREGRDAVLRVEDSGIGIEQDRLALIFELFVQGERGLDRREGGLGIGLTLVKKLVELHAGTVTAASDGPGRGSSFTVRIPSIAAPVAVRLAPNAVGAAGTRRLLVIEDNDDAREALATLLRLDGHEVHVASGGEAGIRCAADVLPDAALVDIGLPDIDGYTVARRLRQLTIGEKMLLVAISGYGQREDRRQSKEAGFDVHLVKPVDADRLRHLITEHSPRVA